MGRHGFSRNLLPPENNIGRKTTRTLPEVYSYSSDLGCGNSNIFLFSPQKFGKMIQFDLRIFLKWVASTHHRFAMIMPRSRWWLRSHGGAAPGSSACWQESAKVAVFVGWLVDCLQYADAIVTCEIWSSGACFGSWKVDV